MSIVSNAKEIADLVKKIGDIELYRKIVELEGEIIELTREKHTLEIRVDELSKTLASRGKMTFQEPFYFQEGDAVPFCPNCWESEYRTVHLINGGRYDGGKIRFDCPTCKQLYWDRH
jgi:hypothetical protein